MRRDIGVVGWIEECRIDAIGDAPKIIAPIAQQPVESLAELGGQDLLRVALAHRRHDIGRGDRARHRVRLVTSFHREARARKARDLAAVSPHGFCQFGQCSRGTQLGTPVGRSGSA